MTHNQRELRSMILLAAMALISIILAGCFSDILPSRHLKRKVEANEVIGTWILTSSSVEVFRRMEMWMPNGSRFSITFDASGKCEFQSYGEQAERFITAEGSWKLEYGPALGRYKGNSNMLEIEFGQQGNKSYQNLYFTESKGKLKLFHYLGDPHDRIFIEYEKGKGS